MRVDDWTEAQLAAAPLLARGVSYRNVAAHVQCHERSISNWMGNPLYKKYVYEIRDRALERTVASLTTYSTEAVKTLHSLLNDPTHAIRLGAAKSILELMIRVRDMAEMDTRLTALEAKIAASEQPAPRPYGSRLASS